MSTTNVGTYNVFCWVDLGASDVDAAARFYGTVFGWERDQEAAGGMRYSFLKKDGMNVGGLFQGPPRSPAGWLSHILVEDAKATVENARSLGGQIVDPGSDVADFGHMALIEDPTGAIFAIWQPRQPGAGGDNPNAVGTVNWNELLTTDTNKAEDFYTGLFGWKTESMPMVGLVGSGAESTAPTGDYTVFLLDRAVAGMVEAAGARAHWLPYFTVADPDATVRVALENGGHTIAGPMEAPEVGRFATLAGPAGEIFGIIRPPLR